MKEWKVLLDKTVEDNSITYYTADAQGCTDFFVSVFFANDAEITTSVNGKISVNCEGVSPWSGGIPVTGNIPSLAYKQDGNNNKAVTLMFSLICRKIIPISGHQSFNNAMLSESLARSDATVLNINTERTELSFHEVQQIDDIAVGSYTKYFGIGSKILILGR